MTETAPTPCVLAVHRSDRHAFSKAPCPSVRLLEGWGVEGDAHAGTLNQHLYHQRTFGPSPNLRQVHLMPAELFDTVAVHGHTVRPGELGENVSTRGVDLLALPTGTRLRLGDSAVLELTGLRNPCHQIEDFQAGLLKHLVEKRPEGIVRRGGVMAVVVASGEVRPGDPIAVVLPPLPHRPLVYRTPV